MDQDTTTTPAPVTEPAPQTTEKSGMGPLVGIIIVLALLLFGGLYFWGTHLNEKKGMEALPLIPGEAIVTPEVATNDDLSTSDETAAIEADTSDAYMAKLQADLDADLKALESDLGSL